MRRFMLVTSCAFAVASAVVGDTLELKDGRTFKGDATREGDTWTIVTVDGQTLTFNKSEVKRSEFDSRVAPMDALRKLQEFRELVEPALNAEPPREFVFFKNITDQASSFRYEETSGRVSVAGVDTARVGPVTSKRGASASAGGRQVSGGSSTHTESKTLRDKDIDAVFVQEWAEYVANFDRLAADLRFKELVKRGKNKGSLYEFALYPPDGYESQGEAILQAIKAVEGCIDFAQNTNRAIAALPFNKHNLEIEIERAQDDVAHAQARLDDAKEENRDARKRILREEKDDLRNKVTRMNEIIPQQSRSAEKRMNEFASLREVTRGTLATASKLTGEGPLDRGPRRPAEDPTLKELSEALLQTRNIVAEHRQRAAGMTTLGLDQLRDDNRSRIDALFENKPFHMTVYVHDSRRTEGSAAGYELLVGNGPAGDADSTLRAHLKFDDRLRGKIVTCPKGASVSLIALIEDVQLDPWLELEKAAADPNLLLSGLLRDVETDCH